MGSNPSLPLIRYMTLGKLLYPSVFIFLVFKTKVTFVPLHRVVMWIKGTNTSKTLRIGPEMW